MPTINKRFLLKLVLVVLLSGSALTGLHWYQSRRIPEALRRQAERAIASDKPDAAIRHLRQYLEFEPDDVNVQVELANLLRLRGGQWSELHFLHDKILRADPSRDVIRRESLMLALRTGRFSDAAGHAESLLKSSPTDALAWQHLAAAQAGLRQFDAAKVSYETAVKHNPKDPLAWQRLAQFLLVDLKKPQEAKAAVDRMVAALPDNPTAYLTRVRCTLIVDADKPLPPFKQDSLLDDLNKALVQSPDLPDLLLAKAERLQKHRDIVGARATLAAGVAKHPGHADLVRALAWLEVNRGNSAGAVGVLEDALPHAKDGLDLLVPLADLLLEAGNVAKTEDILKKLDRRPGSAVKMQAKYLRSRLAMRAGQWNEAIAILTALRTDAANLSGLEAQANQLLAVCFQKIGEPEKAIEALKLICAKDATHVAAHIALGQLYLTAGRTADAIKVYEIAAASPFVPLSAISTLIRIQMLQLARANARPETWVALEKQLNEYSPRFGTNAPEPAILRAEQATHSGRWRDAVTILKKESARRPQSTLLWCKLAEATGNVEGVAAGLTVLDEAQGFVTDGAEMRLARAKLYAKDPAKLRPLHLLLNSIDAWPDTDQMQFVSGMIEIYDSLGEPNRELWQRLLTRRPNDVELKESFTRAFPDPAAPAPLKTAAEIEAAIRREPNRMESVADWLALQASRGEEAKIKSCLSRLVADPRWAGEPMRRAVAKALRGRDSSNPDELLVICMQPIVEREPGGFGWLADQYKAINQLEKYRTYCSKAKQLSTATIEDWLRYYWSLSYEDQLSVNKEIENSFSEFNRAVFFISQSMSPYSKGLSNLGVGRKIRTSYQRAETQVRLAILQAQLDRVEAVKTLENYLDADQIPAADRAWATRQLAMILVARGEAADRERAAKLLTEPAINQSGVTLVEHRTTAGALAGLHRYLDGDARTAALNRAIELMEQTAKESKSPKDEFSLCGLYKSAGRPDDAVAKLQSLLKSDPGNLDYLLAGLDVLVDAKQYDHARGFAERLLQLGGEEYRVIAAVARFEALRGDAAKALALAESYFRTADPLAGDVPAKTARTADLLDELARMPNVRKSPEYKAFIDAAASKYESLLPERAEALIKLAALLARADRMDEAFARLEKQSRGLPQRIAATAAVSALQIAGGSEAQFVRTRQWLDAAKATEKNSLPLRLTEAEFAALKGDLVAAVATYETILKDHPRNIAALNNLAWLLAAKPDSSRQALELIERAAQETGLTGELLDTRARIRIARNQNAEAAADARVALRYEATPLRHFHLALALKDSNETESNNQIQEAIHKGLTVKQVHPADVETFRNLAERTQNAKVKTQK